MANRNWKPADIDKYKFTELAGPGGYYIITTIAGKNLLIEKLTPDGIKCMVSSLTKEAACDILNTLKVKKRRLKRAS